MHVPRNVWYAAALADEVVRDNILSRTIIGHPVAFYRREDGAPIAMADRCPHRFAPLSRGRLVGDIVQCGYHGLEFDSDGRCARNPYGPCLDTIRVRVFPAVERYGLVWIWLGERDGADPSRIPDLSLLFSDGRRTRFQYHAADYRTDILVDNLLDLTHVTYLHPAYASASASGEREPGNTTVSECDGGTAVEKVERQRLSPPERAGDDDPPHVVTITKWYPGNVMPFEVEFVASGRELGSGRPKRFTHICTPATESSTHYFFSDTRDPTDDEAGDEASDREQRRVVIEEDSPMLAAIDERMHGRPLMEMRPVMLPTDKAALRVRRVLDRLVEGERASVNDDVMVAHASTSE
jgi:vanillate O-demethylase monooxygenase subunit